MTGDYNHITLVGHVTSKPFIKIDKYDFKIVRFFLEVARDSGITDLVTIECKGRLGEIIMEFVGIGKKILVDGSIYLQKTDKEYPDKDHWETVVRIDNMQILTPRSYKKTKEKIK